MTAKILPRYPVYVPSKGRFNNCYTAKFLINDGVPFYLVIEPQEYEDYAGHFDEKYLLVLPGNNVGLLGVRNWIKQHSIESGDARHWQLDDNIRNVVRWYKGKRIYCPSGAALAAAEDFTDRYENVAVSGLNYEMFGIGKAPPFILNCRVYSCSLINNKIPFQWRLRYNDDTDLCLQALASGWCTILINVFLVKKMRTMVLKGGNTDDLYRGDGRLKMARSLERIWPGVVTTDRRFKRPQHVVRDSWRKFDTPLIRRSDIDWNKLQQPNEYGMKLVQVAETIKSVKLRRLIKEQ